MKTFLIILALLFYQLILYSQGLVSYGGFLNSTSGAFIQAENTASITLEDYSSDPGSINLDGTTQIAGDLINNTSSSTVINLSEGKIIFDGSSTQTVGGSNSIEFQEIEIDNNVELSNDIIINSNLNFVSGILSVESSDVHITDGSSITGYSSSSYINTENSGDLYHYIKTTDGQITLPVGTSTSYTPALITLNSGTNQYFSIHLIDGVYENGTSGTVLSETDPVVNRTWVISNETTHNIDLVLQWNETDEVNGFDRTSAFSSIYESGWSSESTTVSGSNPYQVTFSAVTDLGSAGVMTFSDNTQPLAIELLYFFGQAINSGNKISWGTATETNSDYFILLKSANNVDFEEIATIKSVGNSYFPNDYSFSDKLDIEGTHYYMLKEVGTNGDVDALGTISISNSISGINVWQNGDKIVISNINTDNKHVNFTLFDVSGRIIESRNVVLNGSKMQLSTNTLAKGIYFIQLQDNSQIIAKERFIVN